MIAPAKLKLSFAQRVPADPMPRALISDKVQAEYLKTARVVAEEPWSMHKVFARKARLDH